MSYCCIPNHQIQQIITIWHLRIQDPYPIFNGRCNPISLVFRWGLGFPYIAEVSLTLLALDICVYCTLKKFLNIALIYLNFIFWTKAIVLSCWSGFSWFCMQYRINSSCDFITMAKRWQHVEDNWMTHKLTSHIHWPLSEVRNCIFVTVLSSKRSYQKMQR